MGSKSKYKTLQFDMVQHCAFMPPSLMSASIMQHESGVCEPKC